MTRCSLTTAVVLLAGCAVGPDYESPQIESPAGFVAADDAVYAATDPVLAWWRTLDDPLLHEWFETALLRNHDIRIAETNLRAARAVLGSRRLERYPIATSQLSAIEQDQSAAVSLSPEQRLYDASLDVAWEVDFFGRVRRSVQAAAADANAATEALRDTYVIVSAELARTYFELKGARYRLSVAQRNAENQRQTFELTQALLDGGRGTDLDIARARAQLESTLASIPPLEREINSGSQRLAVLVGELPETFAQALATVNADLPPLPQVLDIGDPAGLLRRRADVRFAEFALQAETARVGVAMGDLFPRVSLLGSVGWVATAASDLGEGGTRATSFGPFLSWAAFDLGRVRAGIRVANADMDAALLRYEQTVLVALEETENALFGFTSARVRQGRLEVAAEASQQAAELARLRYRDGADSFLTVLDAERRLLEAQDQLAQSATDTALGFVLLYKALGGGWQAVDERLQAVE